MKVIYIAGPFRGANGWEVAENVFAATRAGFDVACLGAMPLIPHANTAHFDGTKDDAFWLEGTTELLRRCDALYLAVPGDRAEGSKGTMAELRLARQLQMPVFEQHELQELRNWLEGAEPAIRTTRELVKTLMAQPSDGPICLDSSYRTTVSPPRPRKDNGA